MDWLFSAFLGIIQGLTEFLPISSSGHLAILQGFFGMQDVSESNAVFDVLLHFGTLLAIFVVYWRDIAILIIEFIEMIGEVFRGRRLKLSNTHRRMVAAIILSVIPLLFVLPVKDYIYKLYDSTLFVGAALIITGIILRLPEIMVHNFKTMKQLKPKDGFIIGLFQMVATLPGISRSGMTISGSMFTGLDRESAVKFSFIMSIPAVLGANILEMKHLDAQHMTGSDMIATAIGVVCAFVFGIISIKIIAWLGKKKDFKVFSYYCFIVGVVVIIASLVFK